MRISGKTKVYGIIGHPVEHSLSPMFQSYFIEQSGMDAVYVPFPVRPEELRNALQGLWAADVQGLNITVPHKERVMDHVQVDDSARIIGAVNTLVRDEQGWRGLNTDWQGFRMALLGMGVDLQRRSVLMFGAGGTAKAVIYALVKSGVSKLLICNRTRERGQTLATHVREHYSHIDCEIVEWTEDDVEAACLSSSILINTTSIGLQQGDRFPFNLKGEAVAVDVVYRPDGQTAFLTAAGKASGAGIDGLPMLIAQGAAAFEKWSGKEIPDLMNTLRWMEAELSRDPLSLTGWEHRA